MNLNAIAGTAVAPVNAPETVFVRISDGYDVNPDKSRTPRFLPPVKVLGQVQNLTFRDLQQIEGLNLQGTRRAIYLNGRIDGIVRNEGKGGDLVTITGGVNEGEWLVAMVLESWEGWCRVAATLQRRPNLAPAAGV